MGTLLKYRNYDFSESSLTISVNLDAIRHTIRTDSHHAAWAFIL